MIYKAIEKIYRNMLFRRMDPDGSIKYFSASDFEGLKAEPFTFTSKRGHTLQGNFYLYEDRMPDRLVVLDHGMGNGHQAYMREIERIASEGCVVFSYDHTGCNLSGGESINGFAQSLSDLDACLGAIKKHPVYGSRVISVIGHSWGGFSTLNIAAFHPDVKNIVAMSGFISVDRMLEQFFKGLLAPFRKRIKAIETAANPVYSEVSAIDTLAKSAVNALVIHSDDDRTVSAKLHFYTLKNALDGKGNVRFLSLTGKDHNPNYTLNALRLLKEFFAQLQKKQKKKELQTREQKEAFVNGFDWYGMTEQDEEVWKEIFKTLFA